MKGPHPYIIPMKEQDKKRWVSGESADKKDMNGVNNETDGASKNEGNKKTGVRNENCPFKTYSQYQTVKDHSDDPIWDSCTATENQNFYGIGICKESWECQGTRTCNIGKNETIGKCDGHSLCKSDKDDECKIDG